MAAFEISVKSLEYVKVQITATRNGAAVDPTPDTVKLAFPAVGTDPTTWYTGSWETASGIYYARCLVGPGGTVTLAEGYYDVYVQVTDSTEVPVKKATDTLQVV